jgi:hypothetical protein
LDGSAGTEAVAGAPRIKDVCAKCNNVVLSRLDTYGLQLYRDSFSRIFEREQSVCFEYDYDKLLRWLLKLNYNSGRANRAEDTEHLKKLRWYMIGERKRPKRISLFVTLLHAESGRRSG